MCNRRFAIHLLVMITTLLLVSSVTVLAATVPRMGSDELKTHLGDENFIVLDVRTGGDWTGSKEKILGAERVDPGTVNQWADNYDKEKTIILYCS